MSKITKAIAQDVASILADKAFADKINAVNETIAAIGDELIATNVAADILDAYAMYPDYFPAHRKLISVMKAGTEEPSWSNVVTLRTTNENPIGDKIVFPVKEDIYEYAKNLVSMRQKLNSDRVALTRELEQTFYELRTRKRVEDNFPEAKDAISQVMGEKISKEQIEEIRKQL